MNPRAPQAQVQVGPQGNLVGPHQNPIPQRNNSAEAMPTIPPATIILSQAGCPQHTAPDGKSEVHLRCTSSKPTATAQVPMRQGHRTHTQQRHRLPGPILRPLRHPRPSASIHASGPASATLQPTYREPPAPTPYPRAREGTRPSGGKGQRRMEGG